MGVLWRKRSLLIKLVVIVGTAWFTIAFLLYTDQQTTDNRIALPLQDNSVNKRVHENIAEPERVVPFKEQDEPPQRRNNEEDRNNIEERDRVLVPPQDLPGENGKAVVLPTNLTGKLYGRKRNS